MYGKSILEHLTENEVGEVVARAYRRDAGFEHSRSTARGS